MDELKQRIMAEQQSPFADLFEGLQASSAQYQQHLQAKDVHIISFQQFGVQQGIHSIEYPKGSGNNIVLAFQSQKACVKFANALRAQHFFDPTVRCCCEMRGDRQVATMRCLLGCRKRSPS
jgi:hypothetical protein